MLAVAWTSRDDFVGVRPVAACLLLADRTAAMVDITSCRPARYRDRRLSVLPEARGTFHPYDHLRSSHPTHTYARPRGALSHTLSDVVHALRHQKNRR